MSVRLLPAAALLAGAAVLSACNPVRSHGHAFRWTHDMGPFHTSADDSPLAAPARLDCPDEEGELKRVSVEADGRACRYEGDGRQVDLKLVAVADGGPAAALRPLEGEVAGIVPLKGGGADLVNVQASGDEDGHGDGGAKIDLPGLHINAAGNKADIKILGTDIKADGDRADINTGMLGRTAQIHAGPGGAEIRSGQVGKHAADLIYIRAGDTADADGWKAAGFRARGPIGGPLVVAEFRSKDREGRADRDDFDRLIDRNLKPAS